MQIARSSSPDDAEKTLSTKTLSTRGGLRRPHVLARLLARGLIVLAVLGCRGETPAEGPVRVSWPDGAVDVFDRHGLASEGEVRRWSAEQSSALLAEGLAVELEAATVDCLDLEIPPPVTFPILAWTFDQGEPPGARQGKGRIHGRPIGPGSRIFRFELGDQLSWRGRVRSLRLEPASFAVLDEARRRKLGGLRAMARTLEPEALASAVARPWKVDLGFELRDARLAPPGLPVEWRPETPIGSGARTLRFAYGLEKGVRQAIDFRVVALPGEADLFTARLEPSEAGSWQSAVLYSVVQEGAGAIEALRFETSVAITGGRSDPPIPRLERGFPVWGGIELASEGVQAPRPPNVILISIDTLRADHLGLYGYEHETAPHLAAWARRHAVVFENAIAPSPWTLPSHVSMLTGRDAIAHGIYFDRPLPTSFETLAESLRGRGYRTLAITGGGYLNPRFGLAQGFDTYRYWAAAEGEIESGSEHLHRWLDELSQDDGAGEPFFLFFHTYEVHSPFRVRPPHFERLGGRPEVDPASLIDLDHLPMGGNPLLQLRKGLLRVAADGTQQGVELDEVEESADLDELRRRYDSGIAHVDALLAPLWERLAVGGLGENTLVILTSDHGEALGERGLAGHAYLWDFNLHIPLVVALPGGRSGGLRVAQQVRTLDIVPTVLDLLGIPSPAAVDGTSLLPLIDAGGEPVDDFPAEAWSYAASSNYGVSLRRSNRRGSLKYIYNDTAFDPALGRAELYDLVADPGEASELLATAGEDGERLRRRVLAQLLRRGRGLELVIENPGPGALTGQLKGPPIQAMKVKSWGEGCRSCFALAAGAVRFAVPAGETGHLVLLDPGQGDRLALELERPSEETWQTPLALAEVGEGLEAWRGDTGWQLGEPGIASEEAPRLSVRWLGAVGAEGETPEVEDPRLREQLEALGYVDG